MIAQSDKDTTFPPLSCVVCRRTNLVASDFSKLMQHVLRLNPAAVTKLWCSACVSAARRPVEPPAAVRDQTTHHTHGAACRLSRRWRRWRRPPAPLAAHFREPRAAGRHHRPRRHSQRRIPRRHSQRRICATASCSARATCHPRCSPLEPARALRAPTLVCMCVQPAATEHLKDRRSSPCGDSTALPANCG